MERPLRNRQLYLSAIREKQVKLCVVIKRHILKGSLQASVTIRKCGIITKYTEICIAGNPPNVNFTGLLQARVTVRKFGVITKCNEISIDGIPLKFDLGLIVKGDTHQFKAAPLHNEAMAASIAGETR